MKDDSEMNMLVPDVSDASQVLLDVLQVPDTSQVPSNTSRSLLDALQVLPSSLVMSTEPFSPRKVKSTIRRWFGDEENGLNPIGMQATGLFFNIDISVSSYHSFSVLSNLSIIVNDVVTTL
jgi:hypothetical protein